MQTCKRGKLYTSETNNAVAGECTYPESTPDVDLSRDGQDGRVAVACRHLSNNDASDIDE